MDYIAKGNFLESEWIKLIEEKFSLMLCYSYIHTIQQPGKLAVINDTVLVRVLFLK